MTPSSCTELPATTRLLPDYRAVGSSNKHHLLKTTTNDEDPGEEEDRDEEEQPGDHKKGPVGSLRRRCPEPPSPPSSVSSTAGCPSLPHTAPDPYRGQDSKQQPRLTLLTVLSMLVLSRYVKLAPALHQKSGSDTRGGSSVLNKPPLLVVACNFGAKPAKPERRSASVELAL